MNGPGYTTKLRTILLLPENRPNYIIAAKMGITPTRLSEYSNGKRAIPMHHLVIMTRYFNCEPEDITGRVDVGLISQ
jgi:hypothetical protein